jgi:hypothetical protein
MWVGGQRHTPAALPSGKTRYPLYRRLGGPQSLSGRVRKKSPPPEFDPRTVQPVASRYTDCAILVPLLALLLYTLRYTFSMKMKLISPPNIQPCTKVT